MKIYTRTGDDGTTGLFGGGRVEKTHVRIDAYGTADELNSALGLVRAELGGSAGAGSLDAVLAELQSGLFVLGADLATPSEARPSVPRISDEYVIRLERWIDEFDAQLTPLKQFILPGGTPAAAALHLARTICRRAERLTVGAADTESINPQCIVYLNRLSDLLFVLARWVNMQAGVQEAAWDPSSAKR
jgi:cob(I)alamin adenosyltransferase